MRDIGAVAKARRFVDWVREQTGARVTSASRTPHDVMTRRAVVLVLRGWGLSTTECAKLVNKLHTTVLIHEKLGRDDVELRAHAQRLRTAFENHVDRDVTRAGGEDLTRAVLLDHMTYRAAQIVIDRSAAYSGSLLAALESIVLENAKGGRASGAASGV